MNWDKICQVFSLLLIGFLPGLGWGEEHYGGSQPEDFRMQTLSKVQENVVENRGSAWFVDKDNFPALDGVTCFTIEIWEESMRLPHWHPNASELGYVVSGTIEIILWRSPGETAVFTVGEGMCWFIPQGSLHSLNNLGEGKARLLVSFSADSPQNVDLPVAFNGVPAPLRDAYTSPHAELKKWSGVTESPYFGQYVVDEAIKNQRTGSVYKFDLSQVSPLFSDPEMGSVIWGVKDNWSILENISVLRAHLKPGVARDAIWYPDVGTLYVVSQGKGEFYLTIPNQPSKALPVGVCDYVFVPTGMLHTFINNSSEDFEVVAFFTNENPKPEVSLSVATSFFPDSIRKSAMTEYGTVQKSGDPLTVLNFKKASPYLLKIPTKGSAVKARRSYTKNESGCQR